jgi:hypothetical protein
MSGQGGARTKMFLACSVVTILGTSPFNGFLPDPAPAATPLLPVPVPLPLADPAFGPRWARYGFSVEGPASELPILDRFEGGSVDMEAILCIPKVYKDENRERESVCAHC